MSFGLTLFLFRTQNTPVQNYLLGLLALFFLATAIRSPGIPYSYYFQRYWWSEVALIILLILVLSCRATTTTSKQRLWAESLVVSTILVQTLLFNTTSTIYTETGSKTTRDLQAFAEFIKEEVDHLAFTSNVSPEFTSGVIIPLRYHFELKISRIDLSTSLPDEMQGISLISDVPCAAGTEIASRKIAIKRLRNVGDMSLGAWVNDDRSIYVCEPKRIYRNAMVDE
jgi:hypothetical protein